jgi:quercetin 2,3-dioxygenase
MNLRTVAFIAEPTIAKEANGVTIRRSIGNERMIIFDPILLVDHLTIGEHLEPGNDVIGFPRHPHRGIETLTLVYDGQVTHKDSLGNDNEVGGGSVQWMTAGGGIFHEEYLRLVDGKVEALQLWFNLPSDQKMNPASYQHATPESIPTLQISGASVKVIAGKYDETEGVFQGVGCNPNVYQVRMNAGGELKFLTEQEHNALLYVMRGSVKVSEIEVSNGRTAILSKGDGLQVSASGETELVFVSSTPLKEPVLQYRSIVMNTPEEIGKSISDLANGTFTQH